MTTYNLNGLTEAQLQTTAKALDVYFRLGLGQLRDGLECLPFRKDLSIGQWEIMRNVAYLLYPHMIDGVDCMGASLGINSPQLREEYRVAADTKKVIRHFLAHKNRPLQPGQMPSVDHDKPMKYSQQPLPTITEN